MSAPMAVENAKKGCSSRERVGISGEVAAEVWKNSTVLADKAGSGKKTNN
jgi:hypothetical protein